jgi:hypothetical protein
MLSYFSGCCHYDVYPQIALQVVPAVGRFSGEVSLKSHAQRQYDSIAFDPARPPNDKFPSIGRALVGSLR